MNGCVFRYANTVEGWYYREWNKAERKYRTQKITGANTLEEALSNAYKVLVSFNTSEAQVKPRAKKKEDTIIDEIKEFVLWEEKRVIAGLKDDQAATRRVQSLKRFVEYLTLKKIEYPSQIDVNLLDDYIFYRKGIKKNTVKTELKDIGTFLRQYLNKNGKLSNEISSSQHLIPKIQLSEDDLDANPAINQDDYNIINEYIRKGWRNTAANRNGQYTRRWFHTFIHLMWNGGFRPSELLSVRIRDVTITNPKRQNSKGEWVDDFKMSIFVRKSKTGRKRVVPLTSNAADNFMEFRKYQDMWFEHYKPGFKMSADSLLFGKPNEGMEKGYVYRYVNEIWADYILAKVKDKLKGNKFSDRPYTVYSLRTSFITKCIERGLDVYLTAELVGNSVTIIQRIYHKYDVMKNAEEIQSIKRGRKQTRPEPEVIDVLNL